MQHTRRQFFLPLVQSIILFVISAVNGQEDYSKWSHSQRILLNTTNASGSNISGNLFSFPVLIRLHQGNFRYFSQTRDSGADIRFAKPDGTHLPYQIERWNDKAGNNDTAEIWVKVDTLLGNSVAQNIVMFWGNSNAGDSSNSKKVFSTDNHSRGIWHMNESTDTLFDATINGYKAARFGNMVRAAGEIGYGQTLDGTGDYADMGNVLNLDTSNVTISAWVKRNAVNKWQTIVTKTNGGNPSSTYGWHFCFNSTNNVVFYLASGGAAWGDTGTYKHTTSKTISDLTSWHHIAVVVDRSANSACKIYIDGIDSSGIVQGNITSVGNVFNSVNARIGSESDNEFQFSGSLDEITIAGIARSANWIRLCYENQKPSQTLVTTSGRLWWDSSASSGIQAANGTWGSNAYWSPGNTTGKVLTTWPGFGYTAAFGGSSGNYTVTVLGTQLVDSIVFEANTYTLKGDTLSFGSIPGVIKLLNKDISASISSAISGTAGLTLYGGGGTGSGRSTLNLSGKSSYTGVTTLTSHISCNVDYLTDGGKSSPLGTSASGATNLLLDDAVLRYTGSTTSTDRLFTVTNNGASLYSSGTGALSFINNDSIVFSGSGNHSLELGGTYAGGPNMFAPIIQDGTGGATSVTKTGAGNSWIFTGTHTYTGATTVQGGSLIINGTIGAASAVTIAGGATIGGNGAIKGTVDVAGIIEPGNGGIGKLRTGSLTLRSSSILNFELGSASDSLIVNGDLTLDGTLNVATTTEFSPGIRQLISWTGKLTDNSIAAGTLPANSIIRLTDSTLLICFVDTPKIIVQPMSDTVMIGEQFNVSVTVRDTVQCTYQWYRVGSATPIATSHSLIINSSDSADAAWYYCKITNPVAAITSDTISLVTKKNTQTIKITSQPVPKSITVGDSTGFSVTATGNKLTYIWKKFGSDSSLGNKSTYSIRSATFADNGRYYCIISDSAITINTDTVLLTVVKESAANPLTVTAQALGSGNVRITISNLDKVDISVPAPEVDSIGLWVMAGSLPESVVKATLVRTYGRSRITGTVLLDTLKLPESNFVYGMMTGLFWDDGTVSAFLTGNGTTIDLRDTSTVADTSLDDCIRITDLHFDSLRATIRLSWCIDTKKYSGKLEVGVAYSLKQFPTTMSGKQTVVKIAPCTDTLVTLDEPLLFDTLYYVSIFIRRPGNNWVTGGDSTRNTVRTGRIFRQVVTYFNTELTNDSVKVFNGQVILWKDSTLKNTIVLTDTIEVYRPKLPEGFITVGTPVSFLNAATGPRLFIGFRVNVPDSFTISDVHIYRDSGGVMFVEYATITDSVAGIVYIAARNVKQPFIPMIDTHPMEVSFKTDISTVATPDQDLTDFADVIDNVANVRWWYLYSKADEHPIARDSGIFCDTSNLCKLSISKSSWVISSDFGLRALLVVSDGSFIDTFDLSRPVYRNNSDQFVTVSNRWQPLYPTAELVQTDPDSLIIASISKDKKYDNRYLRLFRWVGIDANRNEEDKWVEYNPEESSTRSLFTLVPGKLLWLKTRENVLLSFGNAKTLSTKDTFIVKLPPNDFTDFGMPYRFGVTIQNILASSGSQSQEIYIMGWNPDKITGQYKCEMVYAPDLPGYMDASIPLNFTSGGGYSFYNPLQDTVVLRIPPTLASTGGVQKLSKKSAAKNWCARLVATEESGYTFPVLNCGYASGLSKSNYPLPPSFNKVHLYFYDRDCNSKQAHYLADNASGGVVKELRIANNSDSLTRISFRFETSGLFPKGYTAHLFDNRTKEYLSEGMVEIPAKTTTSRWLTVGDEELRSRFLATAGKYAYGLHRIYPNPARRIVNICYSVPIGADNHLHVSIIDLQGRTVWDTRITRLLPEGNHTITWDGKCGTGVVGSGMYVVRMSVVTPKGKTVQHFDRCITYLP